MTQTIPGIKNADAPWDLFDPDVYHGDNYNTVLDEDRAILTRVRDFFTTHLDPARPRRGIDVGPGSNLYPSLAMLPFCSEITLLERSTGNIAWLDREIDNYSPSWDPFWQILSQTRHPNSPYRQVRSPRNRLACRAIAQPGSIHKLPQHAWNVGTMFFVAESMTSQLDEFDTAVGSFLGCLQPGSPFAAAFMTGSSGYDVAGIRFPAVDVRPSGIARVLTGHGADYTLHMVDTDLRPGHGMALATGWTAP